MRAKFWRAIDEIPRQPDALMDDAWPLFSSFITIIIMKNTHLLFSFLSIQSFFFRLVISFSSSPEIINREFIQLTNPINTRVQQSLPASFVRDWPTWVLDKDGTLTKIPDDEGFVQPASIDEVWQPVDLKRPSMKLALGLHV